MPKGTRLTFIEYLLTCVRQDSKYFIYIYTFTHLLLAIAQMIWDYSCPNFSDQEIRHWEIKWLAQGHAQLVSGRDDIYLTEWRALILTPNIEGMIQYSCSIGYMGYLGYDPGKSLSSVVATLVWVLGCRSKPNQSWYFQTITVNSEQNVFPVILLYFVVH